ncbi:SH3 domain-containing protein [Leptospira venezuelensis]|uniref:SH3 domain-containing protein n=1 Tax=Leptospira venezuelensis TaxID=1958811 RepID=UPI0012FF8334|nr:SH3 domain-containing protein [Leptospira venezuelensis]
MFLTDANGELLKAEPGPNSTDFRYYYKVLLGGQEIYLSSYRWILGMKKRVGAKSGISLFEKPIEDSKIYRQIPFNSVVTILSEDPKYQHPGDYPGEGGTNWVKVRCDDSIGWVESGYLRNGEFDLRLAEKSFKDLVRENSFEVKSRKKNIKIQWNGIDFKKANCSLEGRPCRTQISFSDPENDYDKLYVQVYYSTFDKDQNLEIEKKISCEVFGFSIKAAYTENSGSGNLKTDLDCKI